MPQEDDFFVVLKDVKGDESSFLDNVDIPLFITDLPKTLLFHSRICMSFLGEISQKHIRLWAQLSTGVRHSTGVNTSDIPNI